MPKRESYIRIRLFDKEKEEWEKFAENNKFPSLSQFIRYVISEYIEHGFSRTSKMNSNGNSISKRELLELFKEQYGKQEKEIEETKQKINELVKERRRIQNIKVEHGTKGEILKWINKFNGKLGSEDIAELIRMEEPETILMLNKMEEQGLIKQTKDMKYEVINNRSN